MNFSTIKYFDTANGFGMRTSLFVSGCNHACPGCFNVAAWDFEAGGEFTQSTIDLIIESLKPRHVQGLTLLGGEPMDTANQPMVYELVRQVREEFGDTKDIWSWTGYVYPQDFSKDSRNPRARTEYTDKLLESIDVLVDGPFVMRLFDLRLKFKGSSNQRVIDMKQTLSTGEVHLLDVGEDPQVAKDIEERNRKRREAQREAARTISGL